MPFDLEATANVRKALAAYRGVRFSIKIGVRAYFARKEAARADVLAAVADARSEGQAHRVAA